MGEFTRFIENVCRFNHHPERAYQPPPAQLGSQDAAPRSDMVQKQQSFITEVAPAIPAVGETPARGPEYR